MNGKVNNIKNNPNVNKAFRDNTVSGAPRHHKAVVFLKLMIILAVLMVPLSVIAFGVLNWQNIFNKKLTKADQPQQVVNQNANANVNEPAGDAYNFDAPIPQENMGDLSNVPKEEIDTLFDNLKK